MLLRPPHQEPRFAVAVPNDRSDLRYYVAVCADVDGNDELLDSCADYEDQDFNLIEGERVDVVLAPFNCN